MHVSRRLLASWRPPHSKGTLEEIEETATRLAFPRLLRQVSRVPVQPSKLCLPRIRPTLRVKLLEKERSSAKEGAPSLQRRDGERV